MSDYIRTTLLFCLAVTWVCCAGELKRVCYYGSWSSNVLSPSNIDAHLCTHMLFAFATLDANGTHLKAESHGDTALYAAFTNGLKHRNTHLKTMLSLGGWTMASKGFVETVKSESNMRHFARNAIHFLRTHNFDGLDIDWEYPADRGSGPEDKANFVKWLQIVHQAFRHEPHLGNKTTLLLSVAVGVTEARVKESYDIPNIANNVDFINLMMYDFHGKWEDTANVHSALYATDNLNVDRFVKYWVAQGAPKSKLIIGMPLYGNTFTLADKHNNQPGAPVTDGGYKPYRDICMLIKTHHIQEHMLTTERVPYIIYNDQFIGYDNVDSITEKAQYVQDNGYGGAMVWAIELDDTTGACGNGSYPLMHAILRTFTPSVIVG